MVGLVNATGLNLGDTLYDEAGPSVKFPPIPAFAPEVFATARPVDTGKTKQFRKGLDQLNEEGVVQVLKDPDWGDASPVLAAVGQLQPAGLHRAAERIGDRVLLPRDGYALKDWLPHERRFAMTGVHGGLTADYRGQKEIHP